VQLRTEWGASYRWKLLGFLELQAAAALALVVTAMAAARSPGPLGWWDGLGALIALVASGGEALSDAQLRAFRARAGNHGKVGDSGLWGLSRHPNYFFEWLGWLAYVPIGLRFTDYPWGYATLLGPLLMYWLLVRVSGIPPLEAHMLRSRPEAFRAYQARVRAFWPIPKAQSQK
jgi:steroid 5-alpha reductase family enzyme